MAVATLNFEKVGDVWATKFLSEGSCVIEMERKDKGLVSVLANIDDMEAVVVTNFENPYSANVIFEVDVPEGLEVTVRSATEVTNAKVLA